MAHGRPQERCAEGGGQVAPVADQRDDGAMDRDKFDTYVRTQLAPTLKPGDVVIWDNLNVHKSPRAAAAIAEKKAWVLFLPRYSPDLNPIEMAFSKLKALLRHEPARTVDGLVERIGQMLHRFHPAECANFFHGAGYQRSS